MIGYLFSRITAWISGLGFAKFRFRMTVELETPDGPISASSVYEVCAYETKDWVSGGRGWGSRLTGEALAIDLPSGQTLFALLRLANGTGGRDDLAHTAMLCLDPQYKSNAFESARRIANGGGVSGRIVLAPTDYPLLVNFEDLLCPVAVQSINPDKISCFFEGEIQSIRILLEISHDNIVFHLDGRLSAMGIEPGRGLDRTKGVSANRTLGQTLGYCDFMRGRLQ